MERKTWWLWFTRIVIALFNHRFDWSVFVFGCNWKKKVSKIQSFVLLLFVINNRLWFNEIVSLWWTIIIIIIIVVVMLFVTIVHIVIIWPIFRQSISIQRCCHQNCVNNNRHIGSIVIIIMMMIMTMANVLAVLTGSNVCYILISMIRSRFVGCLLFFGNCLLWIYKFAYANELIENNLKIASLLLNINELMAFHHIVYSEFVKI